MKIKTPWTAEDVPDLKGKVALVTGATGGLGYECALQLARKGAKVYLGGRNEAKGQDAVDKIKSAIPQANVAFASLDQGSLAAISAFCSSFNNKGEALDILINNAGIMAPPQRQTTSDGFEIQFGTNHLSHFALTAQLLPSLRRSSNPRVVNVSSIAARQGKIKFQDLNAEKSYSQWGTYNQSKLANLLFTFELQRQSEANNWNLKVLAAHPGIARTGLVENGPGTSTWTGWAINKLVHPFISNPQDKGALPILFAATAEEAEKGGYYGVNKFRETTGDVGVAGIPRTARDEAVAKRLWEESEKLTGVQWV